MPDQRKAVPGANAWSPMLLQPTAAYFGHSQVLSKSNRAKERCWSCKCVIEYAINLQAELCVLVVLILQLCDAFSARLIYATLATLPSILRYPLEHLRTPGLTSRPTANICLIAGTCCRRAHSITSYSSQLCETTTKWHLGRVYTSFGSNTNEPPETRHVTRISGGRHGATVMVHRSISD